MLDTFHTIFDYYVLIGLGAAIIILLFSGFLSLKNEPTAAKVVAIVAMLTAIPFVNIFSTWISWSILKPTKNEKG